jgi:hypothetical protein
MDHLERRLPSICDGGAVTITEAQCGQQGAAMIQYPVWGGQDDLGFVF